MAEISIYSCQRLLNVNSTAATSLIFGFPAQYVRIDNLGAVDLFLRPSATCSPTAPSTDEYSITSCAVAGRNNWEYYPPPVSYRQACADMTLGSLSLFTTSTGAGGQKISILAMG